MEDGKFFELGIQSLEALSLSDFKRSPRMANVFILPAADRLTCAVPVKGHLNIITTRPPMIQISDQIFSLKNLNSAPISNDVMVPDEFWIRPSLESAEIISKLPFEQLPTVPNVFWLTDSDTITFASIMGDKAYCLHCPSKALQPT